MNTTAIFLRTLLIVGIVVGCGCRGLVSMSQQAENEKTPSSLSLAGGTLALEPHLKFGPTYKNPKNRELRDLEGRMVIRAPEALGAKINVYHFSVRPVKTGYYVQNYSRDAKGNWSHASAYDAPVDVRVRREAGAVVVDFKLVGWGTGKLNAPAYDVAVSMTIDGEMQRLARQAVAVGSSY
jgi:hypothetical protein